MTFDVFAITPGHGPVTKLLAPSPTATALDLDQVRVFLDTHTGWYAVRCSHDGRYIRPNYGPSNVGGVVAEFLWTDSPFEFRALGPGTQSGQ